MKTGLRQMLTSAVLTQHRAICFRLAEHTVESFILCTSPPLLISSDMSSAAVPKYKLRQSRARLQTASSEPHEELSGDTMIP